MRKACLSKEQLDNGCLRLETMHSSMKLSQERSQFQNTRSAMVRVVTDSKRRAASYGLINVGILPNFWWGLMSKG